VDNPRLWVIECCFGLLEGNTVIANVGSVFVFIPIKVYIRHNDTLYTLSSFAVQAIERKRYGTLSPHYGRQGGSLREIFWNNPPCVRHLGTLRVVGIIPTEYRVTEAVGILCAFNQSTAHDGGSRPRTKLARTRMSYPRSQEVEHSILIFPEVGL
jgi:hypothetical protein